MKLELCNPAGLEARAAPPEPSHNQLLFNISSTGPRNLKAPEDGGNPLVSQELTWYVWKEHIKKAVSGLCAAFFSKKDKLSMVRCNKRKPQESSKLNVHMAYSTFLHLQNSQHTTGVDEKPRQSDHRNLSLSDRHSRVKRKTLVISVTSIGRKTNQDLWSP